jgi:hypothetical protein
MANQNDPIEPAPPAAPVPAPTAAPVPPTRRTVTIPVLPLAIVGAIVVAVLFFGGGVAIGLGIGTHERGPGIIQQFRQGETGGNGGGDIYRFGPGQQNRTPNGGQTASPQNG